MEERASVDNGSWDGPAAMRSCSSAADFRQIAFELTNDSDADSAAHWALPHHARPGAPPNAKGVASALGYFDRTQGLANPSAARSHLEAHQSAIQSTNSLGDFEVRVLSPDWEI